MNKTNGSEESSLLTDLRQVLHDGIDYGASVFALWQAQATSLALSSVAFVILIAFAVLAGLTAFVLLTVALGIWLSHTLGGTGWALLVIGGGYILLAGIAGGVAIRWLKRLNS